MMTFIQQGSGPKVLPTYFTAPLSASGLDKVRIDFSIGAQERWSPMVKLELLHNARTDLYGKSPEEVCRQLEAEDDAKPAPILVVDQDTETNVSVSLCQGWAGNDDFGKDEEVSKLPHLLRIRTSIVWCIHFMLVHA